MTSGKSQGRDETAIPKLLPASPTSHLSTSSHLNPPQCTIIICFSWQSHEDALRYVRLACLFQLDARRVLHLSIPLLLTPSSAVLRPSSLSAAFYPSLKTSVLSSDSGWGRQRAKIPLQWHRSSGRYGASYRLAVSLRAMRGYFRRATQLRRPTSIATTIINCRSL